MNSKSSPRLRVARTATALIALAALAAPLFAREPDPASREGELARIAATTARASDGHLAVLVELFEPPIARYEGGVAGLAATAPEKTGISLLASDRGAVSRYAEYLERRQDEVLERVRSRVPAAEVGARFRTVWNGFALLVPEDALTELAGLPAVKSVHAVRERFLTMDASNAVIRAPAFWAALGGDHSAGAGTKIGIIDTGVDFSNPMFSDPALVPPAGFPRGEAVFTNGKVIVARHFQSLADSRNGDLNLGHRTAQDLVGHGSHSAGVAAGARVDLSGSGRREVTAAGVAPKAWIGSYRIFAPRAYDDNIIAAIESAVADGMDVINMSFGGPPLGDPMRDPTIIATENAVAAGVVATISAGNSGPEPGTVGYPAAAPSAITVGATTNSHYGLNSLAIFEVTSGRPSVPPALASIVAGACSGSCTLPLSPLSAPLQDVDVVDGDATGIACTSLPGGSMNGRIALVQRGTCTFAVKGQILQSAGAVGMVVYNSDDPALSNGGEHLLNPHLTQPSIPALIVRRSDGLALKAFIADNAAGAPAVGQLRAAPAGTPPFAGPTPAERLTSFSSRGPTVDLQIKPELATIGSDSYAPCQDDSPEGENRFPAPDPRGGESALYDPSGFRFAAGTSFSAPRVAGAAALVKQKHPAWTPERIRAALMETASRPAEDGKLGSERVMARGAGAVDLAAAATVESLVLPASASFGRVTTQSAPLGLGKTFTLENHSSATVTYSIAASRSAGDPAVTASVEPSTVTLAPGASAELTLRLSVAGSVAPRSTDSEGFLAVSDGRMTIPEVLYVPWWIRTAPLAPPTSLRPPGGGKRK